MITPARLVHPLITVTLLGKRVIIYIRQSTLIQRDENWGSTEVQREQVELAKMYGWTDEQIQVIEADLGKSGSTTEGRSGWHEMMRAIASGDVGAVFATNVSRLARSVGDFEAFRVLCRYHGVVPFLDRRPCDLNSPADTTMTQVMAAFAQHDNSQRAETSRLSRLAKATRGQIVSTLPVGWIKGADGEWQYDPEAKPVIDRVFVILRQARSLRAAVRALKDEGVMLPIRHRGKLEWRVPSLHRVRQYVVNAAYIGDYLFARTEMRPNPDDPFARNVQVAAPEAKWIRLESRLPPYLTRQEQEALQEKARQNAFRKRDRPGRGNALCQGILQCAECNYKLTVADPRNRDLAHYYQCTSRSSQLAVRSCMSFAGRDLDLAVERLVLEALRSPPASVLENALRIAQADEQAAIEHRDAERARLRYVESQARERYEHTDPKLDRVWTFAQRQLQDATLAREQFEKTLTLAAHNVANDSASGPEIAELCAIASDLPRLWRDSSVTSQDRKEIVRCLIESVIVSRSDETLDCTVNWISGAVTKLALLRRAGLHRWIAEMHAAGHSVPRIRAILAAGRSDSGQSWDFTPSGLYQILKRLGVPPRPVARPRATQAISESRRMYAAGHTYEEIIAELTRLGITNSRGGQVTMAALSSWLGADPGRRRALEAIHREALVDAAVRGLSNWKIALQLNERGIARVGRRPWTADAVRQRKTQLGIAKMIHKSPRVPIGVRKAREPQGVLLNAQPQDT